MNLFRKDRTKGALEAVAAFQKSIQELMASMQATSEKALKFAENNLHYIAIGRITTHWTYVEVTLDYWILAAHNGANGATLIQADIPRSLKTKITYLKRAHKELPPLIPLAAEAGEVIAEIHRLKEKRHDIIHGYVESQATTLIESEKLQYIRHRPDGARIREEVREYSWEDLAQLEVDIIALAKRANALTARVIEVIDDPQNSGG